MTNPLIKQGVGVRHEPNGLVFLKIGEAEYSFEYHAALLISDWLRLHGQQAKRKAGDGIPWIRAAGIIEDAEEAYKRGW